MDKEKHVDESWKEQACEEKDKLAKTSDRRTGGEKTSNGESATGASGQTVAQPEDPGRKAEEAQAWEVNFLNYVTSLGFQAMIFMGEIPNPITNAAEKNLGQAKFLIDTMTMLREKTSGNLNDQEKDVLENSIYELQMKYVQASQQETLSEEKKAA